MPFAKKVTKTPTEEIVDIPKPQPEPKVKPLPDIPDIPFRVKLTVPMVATYLKRGARQVEIARICGVSRQWVDEYIDTHYEELGPLVEKDDSYQAMQAKHIAIKTGHRIEKALDDAMTKKDLIALNAVYGTATDKYRLHTNQSTVNTSSWLRIINDVPV